VSVQLELDTASSKFKLTSINIAAHSMEEAEVLCDRIGIIANGTLQCIGNSKEVHQHAPINLSYLTNDH
jgi:ABC-type multidrug transport system ATPase subunit